MKLAGFSSVHVHTDGSKPRLQDERTAMDQTADSEILNASMRSAEGAERLKNQQGGDTMMEVRYGQAWRMSYHEQKGKKPKDGYDRFRCPVARIHKCNARSKLINGELVPIIYAGEHPSNRHTHPHDPHDEEVDKW